MLINKDIQITNRLMGSIPHGADLLQSLTKIAVDNNITLGRVEAIGAVQKACIGFYDQSTKTYDHVKLEAPLEILNLTGNISIKDGKPMVHAHVTLSDHQGKAIGGHLFEGTTVFACEWLIEVFTGPELVRKLDDKTGLTLWSKDS